MNAQLARFIVRVQCRTHPVWCAQVVVGSVFELVVATGSLPWSPGFIRRFHKYCDSDAARQMADQPTLKRRSRHISIRYRLISRSVRCMETQIIHIPGAHNPADLLTKAKFGAEFRHLWNLLMKPGDHGREPAATTSSNTESTTT